MGVESMQAKEGGEHLLFKRRPTMEEFGDALKAYGVLFKALTGEEGKYTDFTDFLVRMGFVEGQTTFVPSDTGAVVLQAKKDLYFTADGTHDYEPVLFMKKGDLRVMVGARSGRVGYQYIEHTQDNFRFFLAADALKKEAADGVPAPARQ